MKLCQKRKKLGTLTLTTNIRLACPSASQTENSAQQDSSDLTRE